MKKQFKIYKLDYVFVLVILLFISIFFFRNYIFKKPIYTIGQVSGFTFHRSSGEAVNYVYYINDKKYNGSNNVNVSNTSNLIGGYYELEVSKTDHNYSLIDLEKEIIDKIEIKKAGFKNE